MNRRAGKPTTKKTTQLVNVEEHVEGFRQVREAHRRELIDDYVELISDLIREVGEARGGYGRTHRGVAANRCQNVKTSGVGRADRDDPGAGCFSPLKAKSWRRRAASAIRSSRIFTGAGRQPGNCPSGCRRYGTPRQRRDAGEVPRIYAQIWPRR